MIVYTVLHCTYNRRNRTKMTVDCLNFFTSCCRSTIFPSTTPNILNWIISIKLIVIDYSYCHEVSYSRIVTSCRIFVSNGGGYSKDCTVYNNI